jgi:hypothetical protein
MSNELVHESVRQKAEVLLKNISEFFYCMIFYGPSQGPDLILEKVFNILPDDFKDEIGKRDLANSKFSRTSKVELCVEAPKDYIRKVMQIISEGTPVSFDDEMCEILATGIEVYTILNKLNPSTHSANLRSTLESQLNEIKNELTDLIYYDLLNAESEPDKKFQNNLRPYSKDKKTNKGNIVPVRFTDEEIVLIDQIADQAVRKLGTEANRSWVLRQLLKEGHNSLLKKFKE